MNCREVGAAAEERAAAYLTGQGVRIVERNFRCRSGEIDLIGYYGEYLIFFEVKYRSTTEKGSAEEAVDFRKQKQICKVADYYRYIRRISPSQSVRYDVVAIQGAEIRWYQNAFLHIYTR